MSGIAHRARVPTAVFFGDLPLFLIDTNGTNFYDHNSVYFRVMIVFFCIFKNNCFNKQLYQCKY